MYATALSFLNPVFIIRSRMTTGVGRLLKGKESQKTCLNESELDSRGQRQVPMILQDKSGNPGSFV